MTLKRAVAGKNNFGLYKYTGKKKDTYYVRRSGHGKGDLNQKLKSINLADARLEMQEIVGEWLGLKPKSKEIKLFEELWPEWIKIKADKSEATIYSINNSGKHLLEFFGSLLPSEVTPGAWEKYIQKKREDTPSRKFFNDWKWLGMFLIHLHENGIIERRPRLRNPDPAREPGKVLSYPDIQNLLVNSGEALNLQIIMSYTMGTRDNENKCLFWVPEFQGVERSYIDLENRSIILRAKDTKIRRGRTVPLSPDAYNELVHRKSAALGVVVFPSQEDPNQRAHRQSTKGAWTRCRGNTGIKCKFHDLRHTYLTNAFNNAKGVVDAMLICTAAGLSIDEAQRTYLHFNLTDLRPVSRLVGLNGVTDKC